VPNGRDIGIRPAPAHRNALTMALTPASCRTICHRRSVDPYDARPAGWRAYSGGPPLANWRVHVSGLWLIIRRDKTNWQWFALAHPTHFDAALAELDAILPDIMEHIDNAWRQKLQLWGGPLLD